MAGAMPARIGDNGFSANRREGDGITPVGIFGFVYGFGSRPNPGMRGACVSLRHKDLVAVLRRLRPGTRIAMGPAGYLNNRL